MAKKIAKRLKEVPAIAILGPRQCGKTTLAKMLATKLKESAIFLDLERPTDLRKLTDPEAFFTLHQDKCVVLDEVQEKPEIFRILRPLIDANRKSGRYILTGSAAPKLVHGVSDSLVGRISYFELTPLNLTELSAKAKYTTHWMRGGYPDALLAKTDARAFQWLSDYVIGYVQQDLNQLFGVAFASALIGRFWRMLANGHGTLWNAETYARSLSISAPTAMRYLEYMEGAFLIRRLLPWYPNTTKRLVRSPKIYVRDSGLLHSLAGISSHDALLGNPLAGLSWEGYVVEQICQLLSPEVQPYFFATHTGAEIDLLLVKGEKPILAAEIKLSNAAKPSRGFLRKSENAEPPNGLLHLPRHRCLPYPRRRFRNFAARYSGAGTKALAEKIRPFSLQFLRPSALP